MSSKPSISFRSGYKYQLVEPYRCSVGIYPRMVIETKFISLSRSGRLTLKEGYAWDGPSGPAIDTPTFMRGSLVHDALYQLMREGHLDRERTRPWTDRLLYRICREDGMSRIRALIVYLGVILFGEKNTKPSGARPILHAPEVAS